MINKLLDFLKSDHLEAYITGPAGSGKTTILTQLIKHIDIPYLIVTYTHTAKNVIRSKGLPAQTLHSFLKKRPGINSQAKNLKHLQIVTQVGVPERIQLLIIDEFSFIGEKDYYSLGELQDYFCPKCNETTYNEPICPDCNSKALPPIKIIYIGDQNQLPPVNSYPIIEPQGPYVITLDKVHRNNFPILQEVIDMIQGKPIKYLVPDSYIANELPKTSGFYRPKKGTTLDIDKLYLSDPNPSKKMLAYTNKAVQEHNSRIQGRTQPQPGDLVYNSTLKMEHKIVKITRTTREKCYTIKGTIDNETTYNPLKYLNKHKDVVFLYTEDNLVIPAIFGSYTNKIVREEIAKKLVKANQQNKDSKTYYRDYKLLQDYVSIVDFVHCITVHKSQGQEYDNIYIDTKSFTNKTDFLKLLYVAMSRAKNFIIFNN